MYNKVISQPVTQKASAVNCRSSSQKAGCANYMVSMGRDLVIYVLCFVSGSEVRSSFGDGDSYFSKLSY